MRQDGRDLLVDITSKLGALATKIGKDEGEKEIAEMTVIELEGIRKKNRQVMTKSGLLDRTILDDSIIIDDESEVVLADLRNSVQVLDAYSDMISDYEHDVDSD